MPRDRLQKQLIALLSPRFFIYLAMFSLVIAAYIYFRATRTVTVGILVPEAVEQASGEKRALLRYLNSIKHCDARMVAKNELIRDTKRKRNYSILWIHETGREGITWTADTVFYQSLLDFVEQGGSLLLSLQAAELVNELGLEPVRTETRFEWLADTHYGKKRGLRAYHDHPVFEGLHGGGHFFCPEGEFRVSKTGFFGQALPQKGRVIGVDWSSVLLNEDQKLMVEYSPGKGKVLTVGAYLYYSAPNSLRSQTEVFTRNLINYLSGNRSAVKPAYWNFTPGNTYPVAMNSRREPPRRPVSWTLPEDPLLLSRDSSGSEPWNVSGRRMLLMGKENAGIDEVWVHPFMALCQYSAGIVWDGEETIRWLKAEAPAVRSSPSWFSRFYRFGEAWLSETITADPEDPVSVIHYQYNGEDTVRLLVHFQTRFRIMWPYSPHATSDLYYAFDRGLNAFVVFDEPGRHAVVLGANKLPLEQHTGGEPMSLSSLFMGGNVPKDTFLVSGTLVFELAPGENMDIVLAGSVAGTNKGIQTYRRTMADPFRILSRAAEYQEEMAGKVLQLNTPDRDFNLFFNRAKTGIDGLFTHTPGLGRSLLAGFGATSEGWDRGHVTNRRPGYAFYSARDAVWCAFAMLGYGDYEKVRELLETFNRYQNTSGQIFHELTTSGAVYYGAADATPLYIILAGRYLRYSGDISFIRKTWKNLKKAIDFCTSGFTGGELLIANSCEEYEWGESGNLSEQATTLYLASLWAEALKEADYISACLKTKGESQYLKHYKEVVRRINTDLLPGVKANELHSGNNDMVVKSIIPALPAFLGQTGSEKARQLMQVFASNAFSTDWGLRSMAAPETGDDSAGIQPENVLPLFTGWTALAAYKSRKSLQGFTCLMNNMLIYKHRGLGLMEEAMHGQTFQPAGECPHRGWSAAMAIQPVTEGMLGLAPDARKHALSFEPQWPVHWDFAELNQVRIGNHVLNCTMEREPGKIQYHFTHSGPKKLSLRFVPVIPGKPDIISVKLNGETIHPEVDDNYGQTRLKISAGLRNRLSIEICHSGIAYPLPLIREIQPGDTTCLFRVIDAEYAGKGLRILFEGPPGSEHTWQLYSENEPGMARNTELVLREGNVYHYRIRFPESTRSTVRTECILE